MRNLAPATPTAPATTPPTAPTARSTALVLRSATRSTIVHAWTPAPWTALLARMLPRPAIYSSSRGGWASHAALTPLPDTVTALSYAMVSHTSISRTATRPGWAVTAVADIFPGPPVAIAGAGPAVMTIFVAIPAILPVVADILAPVTAIPSIILSVLPQIAAVLTEVSTIFSYLPMVLPNLLAIPTQFLPVAANLIAIAFPEILPQLLPIRSVLFGIAVKLTAILAQLLPVAAELSAVLANFTAVLAKLAAILAKLLPILTALLLALDPLGVIRLEALHGFRVILLELL